MKGLAKLLGVVALIVGAVYGGIKSYIYYQTRDTVEGLVRTAAPFVTIEYGGISSDLWSGTVRVERIKVSPTGIDDSVRVGAASVSAGNLRRLFRLIQRAKDRAPPELLGLALQEVRINLNGDLVRTAERFIAMAAQANPAAAPAAHCGYQSTADLAILRRLGYDALVFDTEFDYDFNKSAEMAKVVGTVKIHDMTRAAFDMKLVGLPAQPADAARAKPQLREFGVVVEDLSYNDRLKRFCAQAAKLSEQEYIAIETGPQSMFFKQLGITPGPGLQQAYRDYLSQPGGTIELRVRPSEDLDPASLKLFKPTDILAMLNATVSVNGKRVQDLSFEIGPVLAARAQPDAKPDSDAKPPPALKSVSAPPTASARAPAADKFRVVQVAELGRYLNRYVRLHERGQNPREGTLVQVGGRVAVLERRYGTGHIVVRVPLPLVDKAEVMY